MYLLINGDEDADDEDRKRDDDSIVFEIPVGSVWRVSWRRSVMVMETVSPGHGWLFLGWIFSGK